MPGTSLPIRTAVIGLVALGALALAGCAPEPAASPSPTSSATSSTPTPAPTSPTPTPTADAGGELTALPQCEDIYSAGMLATLNAETPPLNDPGVTLFSTQNAAALEVLDSGIETVRCSWGTPSERGLATNVSIVDAEQAATVQNALANDGFACADADGGTVCTLDRESIDLDDNLVRTGESHVFRANAWISTAYVDYIPDGYSADIAATIWG